MSERTVVEPERRTPVVRDVDVAVVGGGTAGVVAAIAAARTGASTVLVERFGSLGGCPTIGRCAHLANTFVDSRLRTVTTGIPLEILKRLIEAGGGPHPTLEETLIGSDGFPDYILVDPEILAVVLIEMVEEAGVDMMLHTTFCDPIMERNSLKGVLVHNKAGRQAILAKNIIDASGEADVAFSAGAPCITNPEEPWYLNTFGLLMRLGNVDVDTFLEYFLSIEAGKPNPGFTDWLSDHLGLSVDEIRQDRYWRRFIDPQPVGGVPISHPGAKRFTPETQRWFRERWEKDGDFAYINMHLFRDLMREAVENGHFALKRKIDPVGEVGFNFDGFTGGLQRKGEVLLNAIQPMGGFDAFNSEHISKIETSARKRAVELANFFKGYLPGFEDSYIVDTGVQTMPRHVRMIEGEFTLTAKDVREIRTFDDAIYVTGIEPNPGEPSQVPYRIMLPKIVENLLVAGKCAAGSNFVRPIPSCWAMGQAAGTAAALATRQGVTPRELDVTTLQGALTEQGVELDL